MKKIIILSALAIMPIVLFSCRKEEHPHMDTPEASIAIVSPVDQQVFAKGDTVHIAANLSASSPLHGYQVVVLTAEGDTVFKKSDHAHQNELLVRECLADTFSSAINLKVLVSTKLDHDGNSIEKSVNIKLH